MVFLAFLRSILVALILVFPASLGASKWDARCAGEVARSSGLGEFEVVEQGDFTRASGFFNGESFSDYIGNLRDEIIDALVELGAIEEFPED